MHGQGKLIFSNGNYYEGQFAENKRCGQGTMEWKNAVVRDGVIINDKLGTYVGEWEDDMRNGYGQFTEKAGTVYEG